MELRQLSYFVTVAEELHFGRAAQRLHIVQPAVSQQVRRLERELGADLFARTSRRVTLTEAGTRFLPAAGEVLAAANRARAVVADLVPATVVRLGTSSGIGDHLDRVLERLTPAVTVELVTESTRARIDRLLAGGLDATFVRGPVEHPQLRRIPLWDDPLYAALSARHPLAGSDEVRLADLAPYPLRLIERRHNMPLVDLVVDACRNAGFEPVPAGANGALSDTLAMIGTDTSWTVVYAAHARQVHNSRVVFRPFTTPGLLLPTALLVRCATPPALLPALLAACRIDNES
ncbi:LysR family transcriptional regulator [Nocardia sp. alder85J]|uniref:LysR family transcriptional regulator n=1 Tax=Nocardia sp. alder85J TaxID=2862949 RepID=UPI001CD40F65|nr:LysR family transcriptional regulator [Nocardia sp. alder85J]MCX4099171.1 LysR family transcriptional regulator [Nocardia sp. alder85J]